MFNSPKVKVLHFIDKYKNNKTNKYSEIHRYGSGSIFSKPFHFRWTSKIVNHPFA